MSDQLILDIGASGVFRLKAPYDALIPPQTVYTVKANRRLSEIIASGVDPFEKYYDTVGISNTNYLLDLKQDITIVSMTSSIGQWVHVPANCILSYPDTNGVLYTAIMLGISIGSLPDATSLLPLKTSITNLVKDTLGVECSIKEIAVSPPTLISHEIHENLETTRSVLVTVNRSDRALLTKATTDLAAARAKIVELENYIKVKLSL
jgi:hypothetical protein